MIENYLSTQSEWRRATTPNEYGEAQTTSTTIATRWEWRQRLVTSQTGQQVISRARVYTVVAVNEGDLLVDSSGRPWPVVEVDRIARLDGAEDHRECWL